MSLRAVVRKDILDTRRARVVWAVGLLYTAFTVLYVYGTGSAGTADALFTRLFGMGVLATAVVPLVALVAAYLSVAGERESGSLRFLLTYPNSRRDVVFGKFIARSAVVCGALVVAFAAGLALSFASFETVDLANYAGFVALTLLFALVYVGIAVGVSAATASRFQAMAGVVGTWFVLNVFWNFSPVKPTDVVGFLASRLGVAVSYHEMRFIRSLSPTVAYLRTLDLVVPLNPETGKGLGGHPDLWYLETWVAFAVLVLWLVVPLLFGYWRFERADLE